MIINDDRTEEQKASLPWLVVGTDSFLSGWGLAEGGNSYAAWACAETDLDDCERWVRGRREMKRVRVVEAEFYRPKVDICGHFHIYVYKGQKR